MSVERTNAYYIVYLMSKVFAEIPKYDNCIHFTL